MRLFRLIVLAFVLVCFEVSIGWGQAYGQPDRDQPGDAMIQEYLAREADRLDETFCRTSPRGRIGRSCGPEYRQEYLYMLGLWPMPAKTPLSRPRSPARSKATAMSWTCSTTRAGRGCTSPAISIGRPASSRGSGCRRCCTSAGTPSRAQRQQDRLSVARHLVRPARLRLPGRRHAAARRDRGDPSRHVSRGPLVVALARLHARRRRVPERHPRDRLPDQPAGRGPAADRRHRHQRRRRGHVLDRRGRRAREGRRARSAAWPICRPTSPTA